MDHNLIYSGPDLLLMIPGLLHEWLEPSQDKDNKDVLEERVPVGAIVAVVVVVVVVVAAAAAAAAIVVVVEYPPSERYR